MKKLLLACLMGLAGCNATMPHSLMSSNAPRMPTSADDPTTKCLANTGEDATFWPLASKVGDVTNSSTVTVEMLASQEHATDADKLLIKRWGEVRQDCHMRGEYFRSINAPSYFRTVIEESHSMQLIALARLYSGEYTYGQFNIERKRMRADFGVQWERARTQESQQYASNQQAEASRQAQSAAQLSNALLIMQATRPTPNLTPTPPTRVVCNSQRIFNQVQTVCQ